ncbi:extracellular calcium-sensing receptor-like [Lissotriton helveticus]
MSDWYLGLLPLDTETSPLMEKIAQSLDGVGVERAMDKAFVLTTVSMILKIFMKHIFCLGAVRCWLFCSLIVVSVARSTISRCQHLPLQASGISRGGDIMIGGIFPAHIVAMQGEITFQEEPLTATCQTFAVQNYQWIQAMVFAIEEINNCSTILPNITLGFQIYDTCTMIQWSLKGTLWILSGQDEVIPNFRCQRGLSPAAIIGDSGSTRSILLAHILGLYRFPQISYFSTSPLLSDRNQFPSFFRTIPSDSIQSLGLAQLAIHFGWTWVGIIATDDNYGQLGSQLVQQELIKAEGCVAFKEYILPSRPAKNVFHIVQVIKNSTAKAIVVFTSYPYLPPLLDEIVKQNVTGKIWIASESWSTYSPLSIDKYSKILAGTIGFAIRSGEMASFQKYFTSIRPSTLEGDTFVIKFWEAVFGCQWLPKGTLISEQKTRNCTGAEKLETLPINSMMDFRITYNIYNAVYATAQSLEDLRICMQDRVVPLQEKCANILEFHPWQILHYIKNVRLGREGAETLFDSSGNPPAQYDIVNWQKDPDGTIRHLKVGSYDSSAPPGKTLNVNASAIYWSAGSIQERDVPTSVCSSKCPTGFRKTIMSGKPTCCFKCVPCVLGEISNQSDSIECFVCPWDQWSNENQNKCISKMTDFLSYTETFGVILATISILSSVIPALILGLFICYRNTPIVKASNSHLSYILLLSLTLCFLCSLTFIGYPTQDKCLISQTAFGITFALCISCILAKTIMVVIAFNATKPNSKLRRWTGPKLSYTVIGVSTLIQVILCISWLILSPPFSEKDIHSLPGIIILGCNEGSMVAFWCMLGYLGFLSAISFIVAFLARKLPDSFNEAKFITFSMLAFLSVWVSFIPAYLSTKGKYMVAMEIFAILSSSYSLVCCIFVPKCYIIIFRSKMNTKDYLMGRGARQTKI